MEKHYGKFFDLPIILIVLAISFSSCYHDSSIELNYVNDIEETQLGTNNSYYIDSSYITNTPDFTLYQAWLKLDEAFASQNDFTYIAEYQQSFLFELEKEKQLDSYKIANSMYGIENQIIDMETACKEGNRQELSHLIASFYISKSIVNQKSGSFFM